MMRYIRIYWRNKRLLVLVLFLTLSLTLIRLNQPRESLEAAGEPRQHLKDVVVDINIRRCLKWRRCAPSNGWNGIGGSLSEYSNSWSLYKYYIELRKVPSSKATRGLTDFSLGATPIYALDEEWTHTKTGGLFLWKRYIDTSSADFQTTPIIRYVEILAGDRDLQDTRDKWYFQEQELDLPFGTKIPLHFSSLKLSLTEQQQAEEQRNNFNKAREEGRLILNNDKVRIMQISDMHFTNSFEICTGKECFRDMNTIMFISSVLDEEAIDLIVITGDLIDFAVCHDYRSAVLKALAPIIEKKIPFIFTFGESDTNEFNSAALNSRKRQILSYISSLPGSYNTIPEKDMHGLSNYHISVVRESDSHPMVLLTILDSEDRKIDESQVNYLYRLNQNVGQDVAKLLLFHYPLSIFRPTGVFQLVGSYNQQHELKSKANNKIRDDIVSCGYHVIAVGHEHENDACILDVKTGGDNDKLQNEVWLCYSGVTGDTSKTIFKQDTERTLRIFEYDFATKKLITWKRNEKSGLGFDYQIIKDLENT
ncbi:Piso0_000925 [Millerozyma farinosa CBS 7064]|uniref:Piso0_000925 protein n=1 Tax=Pichia sorbitophila (strain ATCC MYA-4447 / BCRC 22081 / CBS 7064 / NBRC 10061 / NRRL Y-12695) TaxID=559304 RepID=G8YQF6_PICSO|nr:Piso0_000925 [Millerozyma farinosa CBS 7064]